MKILYGVPGEGMGHATRSKVVIEYLISLGHELHVVASSRAYDFLQQNFPGKVSQIKGFHFAFDEKTVSKAGTFMLNLKNLPSNLQHNIRQYFELEKIFKPDLVISDFESFSYLLAKYHRIPVISIDNMQVIDRCRLEIDIPTHQKENYALAKAIVKVKVPACHGYLISSFFDAPVTAEHTWLVPPIIRTEILNLKTTYSGHIVVYQTGIVSENLLHVLRRFEQIQFVVYGADRSFESHNVKFKPFSQDGFLTDFASADAVIANGGFSFLSEAVYLRKPVLSVPIGGQFEQFVNAAYIEKLGYGRHEEKLSVEGIEAFLNDLPQFKSSLAEYRQTGNTLLYKKIGECLTRIMQSESS